AIGPYSQAIKAGGFLFLSGQLPINPVTGVMAKGIVEQTRQAIKNVEALLLSAGLTLGHVVKNSVFLSDLGNFSAMNEVYREFFPEAPPARSCFQVAGIPLGALVEIEAVAVAD
ncbi:MAG: RidA family protein, partial [Dehalococcoidia bacterium]